VSLLHTYKISTHTFLVCVVESQTFFFHKRRRRRK